MQVDLTAAYEHETQHEHMTLAFEQPAAHTMFHMAQDQDYVGTMYTDDVDEDRLAERPYSAEVSPGRDDYLVQHVAAEASPTATDK